MEWLLRRMVAKEIRCLDELLLSIAVAKLGLLLTRLSNFEFHAKTANVTVPDVQSTCTKKIGC